MSSLPTIPVMDFDFGVMNGHHFAGIDSHAIDKALRAGAFMGAQWIQGMWVKIAQDLNIRASGDYIRGIQSEGRIEVMSTNKTIGQGGVVLGWEMVIHITNTAKHASIVENGHAAFSMVQAIDWNGPKVKRTLEGKPYLSIPFRHRAYANEASRARQGLTTATVKAMMPQHIYNRARRLQFRQHANTGPVHARGHYAAADRYTWQHPDRKRGRRLNRSGSKPVFNMGGPGGGDEAGWTEHRSARHIGRQGGRDLNNPAWKHSKYHNLFRTGAPRHSQYMTIRTITPDSPGWNIPAQIGHHVARNLSHFASHSEHLAGVVRGGVDAVLKGGS